MLAGMGILQVKAPSETKKLNLSQIKKLIALFTQAALELKTSPIPQLPLELAVVEYCHPLDAKMDPPIKEEINDEEEDEEPEETEEVKKEEEAESAKPVCDLSVIEEHWAEVLTKVRPLNHSVEAFLRACRPLKVDGEKLILEVFYKFHKEKLETDKCRRIVEDVVTGIVKVPIKVRCVLGDKKTAMGLVNKAKSSTIQETPKEETTNLLEAAQEIFLKN